MLHCDIHQSWCWNIRLRHSPNKMLNCNIHQGLFDIVTVIKLTSHQLWHKMMGMSHCNLLQTLRHMTISMNGYVSMQHTSKYMSQCDKKQCICQIVTFIQVEVTLRHSTKLMSHCDIHQSWRHIAIAIWVNVDEGQIVTFIKVDITFQDS